MLAEPGATAGPQRKGVLGAKLRFLSLHKASSFRGRRPKRAPRASHRVGSPAGPPSAPPPPGSRFPVLRFRFWVIPSSTQGQAPLPVQGGVRGGSHSSLSKTENGDPNLSGATRGRRPDVPSRACSQAAASFAAATRGQRPPGDRRGPAGSSGDVEGLVRTGARPAPAGRKGRTEGRPGGGALARGGASQILPACRAARGFR